MTTILKKRAPQTVAAGKLAAEEQAVLGVLLDLEELAGSPIALVQLVGADKRTIDRWLKGKHLSRLAHFERLRVLQEIILLARRAHGRHALDWFKTPNAHIQNIIPFTLLGDPGGRDVIRGLLEGAVMGGVA